jgi:hypothetical protein
VPQGPAPPRTAAGPTRAGDRRPGWLRVGPQDLEILRLAGPAFGALVAEPLFLLTDSAIVGGRRQDGPDQGTTKGQLLWRQFMHSTSTWLLYPLRRCAPPGPVAGLTGW